ncbi:MAG: S8 family serine peptidase [Actinomycetota bacterium]
MTAPTRPSLFRVAAVLFALYVGVAGPVPAGSAHAGRGIARSTGAGFVDPTLIREVATGLPATVLIGFDERRTTGPQLVSYLRDQGISAQSFERLPVAYACAGSLATLRTLASAPGTRSLYADAQLETALDKSVPTAMNGDPHNVWDGLGITGKGVGLAVIDTGVDATHPDLQYGLRTKLNVRVIVGHRDLLPPPADPCVQDTYTASLQDSEISSGHGTHMASVAAGDGTVSGGRYTGVAPEATIMGVAIDDTVTPNVRTDATGTPTGLSLFGAIAGLNYVALNGIQDGVSPAIMQVKVILAGWVQHGLYDPWHPMALAIHDMSELGIITVFPAGNDGSDTSDCSTADTCHFNMWGASPDAVTVAATPKTSRTILESYSSRGDPLERTFHDATFRYWPLVSAPGTNVVAARRPGIAPFLQPPGSFLGAHGDGSVGLDRRYVALTGTSVSAAHVAGAVALMQQAAVQAKGCYLTTAQVRDILGSTATSMPGYAQWQVGRGDVNITAAVLSARSAPAIHNPEPWMCPGSA